jgi:hypothetical protein
MVNTAPRDITSTYFGLAAWPSFKPILILHYVDGGKRYGTPYIDVRGRRKQAVVCEGDEFRWRFQCVYVRLLIDGFL